MDRLLVFTAGIAGHLVFFRRGERFLYPLRYVQALAILVGTGTIAQVQYAAVRPGAAFQYMLGYLVTFLGGLYFSLLSYRLFINPLNKFPGPFMARLTKLAFVLRVTNMDGHHQLQKLHRKYGKYVRVGPNDLSVIDGDAVQVVSAASSKYTKSSWYQQDYPMISMHTTRDRALHDRRRRVWSPAFSDKALRDYQERIQYYNDALIAELDKRSGTPVDVSTWFNLYSFDVMGDLGFGQSFGMLDTGEKHWAIKLLGQGMDPLALFLPPWLFRVLVAIPGLSGGYHRFIAYCTQQLDDRMKRHDPKQSNDIIGTLIAQYNGSVNQKDALPLIQGDSRLIIVAGSDTTAASLTHLFYWLAKKPELQRQLRDELGGRLDPADLQNNDFLNGIIYESLRLNPPVPSGVFRKTPSQGVSIGNVFVPGDTVIQMPQYVMGHDEDLYHHAEDFIPERFYSKPEYIKHKDAWGPFSSGPFGCIGKNLALMEVRTVTSQIIDKFDVQFADGEDGSKLLQKSRDHFTMELEDLNLVFTKRMA